MNDLSAIQRDMLYIIQSLESPSGVEVQASLESYYDEEVSHGTLYPNLHRLTDAGLVTEGEYNRRTHKYELTDRGRQTIRDRLTWEQSHTTDLIE